MGRNASVSLKHLLEALRARPLPRHPSPCLHAASSTESSLARIPPILLKAGIWIPYFSSSLFMLLISSSGREKTEQMEQIHGSQRRGKKRERSRVGGAETDCSWLMCDNLILETGSGTASWAGLTGYPLTVTNDFHISRSSSALYSQRCQCCSQADGSFTMIYILLYVVTVVEAHSNDMTFSITWWGQGKWKVFPA